MTLEKLDPGAQADAFRERIVTASTELIEEQGLGALSMREVARRAGVSHQAPYYYFADREAILGAIAEQGFRMLGEYVQRSMPQGEGSEQAAIIAAGKAYLEFALEHRAHFRVMFRHELVAPERHPNVSGEGLKACDQFFQIVERAMALVPGPKKPAIESMFLLCWSVVHGLACLMLDGPLDVIMPNADRKRQREDVLATLDQMMQRSLFSPAPAPAPKAGATSRRPSAPKKR